LASFLSSTFCCIRACIISFNSAISESLPLPLPNVLGGVAVQLAFVARRRIILSQWKWF
jgi:hypothetical protein